MAVQKKKKPKKKTSENSKNVEVFKWTPQRKKAALLLSGGSITYEDVAAEVRVHISTLWNWRQCDVFLKEVDRLTLENEKATKAGLLRIAIKALDDKKDGIKNDKNTALDWAKFIADIQGHVKQKVELEGNMKHSNEPDPEEMTDEELRQSIRDDIQKLITAGYVQTGTDEDISASPED